MKKTKKNQRGQDAGFLKNVHINSENEEKNNTIKPPTKAEASLDAFRKCKSLNTFEANQEYGDTCLHSCVSDLNRKYGLVFNRKPETIINRAQRRITVMRYSPADIERMKVVLRELKLARGVKL